MDLQCPLSTHCRLLRYRYHLAMKSYLVSLASMFVGAQACTKNGSDPAGRSAHSEQAVEAERSRTQVWGTSCPDQLAAELRPDGTYTDGGGGQGRWRIEGRILHLTVLEPHKMAFMSLAPELISMDEDGRLPFVEPRVIEAEMGGLKTHFHRCS